VTRSDPEVTSFDRKSPGSGCRNPKLTYCVHLTTYKAVARRRRQSRDRKLRQITSGDWKWLESDVICRKSPWSLCRRPKACIYRTFHILQSFSSQEEAVTWQKMTSRDLRLPEVTRKWRHLTGSYLEVAVEVQKLTYILHFISYKAVARRRRKSRERKWRHVTSGDRKWPGSGHFTKVTWKWLQKAKNSHLLYISNPTRLLLAGGGSHVTGNDITWPQVTERDPKVTSFDLKVPGSGCRRPKNSHILYISFRTRQSPAGGGSHVRGNDVTWPQVTARYPEVTSFRQKSTGSGCRRPKIRLYCTFHFLQGCSSQEEAVTWQEVMSCDLRTPEVTRKGRHFLGSILEVALEGQKIANTVHFTFYKAVACRRRQSRDRK